MFEDALLVSSIGSHLGGLTAAFYQALIYISRAFLGLSKMIEDAGTWQSLRWPLFIWRLCRSRAFSAPRVIEDAIFPGPALH